LLKTIDKVFENKQSYEEAMKKSDLKTTTNAELASKVASLVARPS